MSKSNKCTKCKGSGYNEVVDYSYTISFYSTPTVIRQGTCSMCKGTGLKLKVNRKVR
jgi:DnaJ-class molecular chaperone